MGDNSKIEWTDASWNPLVGCEKVAPGCDNCYAIPTVHRGEAMGTAQHAGLTIRSASGALDWNGQINYVPERIGLVAKWRRPRRIFVNSLSDPFHRDVPDEFLLDLWRAMARAPQHQFQLLTKRPQRMAEFTRLLCWASDDMTTAEPYLTGAEPGEMPLPNVALLTSIENNTYAWRADYVRAANAAIRGVSAEPLLGPLDKLDLTGLDWLIVGGESGKGARPMHPQWVRDLRDRCQERTVVTAGPTVHRAPCAFHFKQWGEWAEGAPDTTGSSLTGNRHQRQASVLLDIEGKVRDTNELHSFRLPDDWVRLSKFGKAATGRELDGRTWDEYPAADVLAGA